MIVCIMPFQETKTKFDFYNSEKHWKLWKTYEGLRIPCEFLKIYSIYCTFLTLPMHK